MHAIGDGKKAKGQEKTKEITKDFFMRDPIMKLHLTMSRKLRK